MSESDQLAPSLPAPSRLAPLLLIGGGLLACVALLALASTWLSGSEKAAAHAAPAAPAAPAVVVPAVNPELVVPPTPNFGAVLEKAVALQNPKSDVAERRAAVLLGELASRHGTTESEVARGVLACVLSLEERGLTTDVLLLMEGLNGLDRSKARKADLGKVLDNYRFARDDSKGHFGAMMKVRELVDRGALSRPFTN